jgi:hypothetical protein
MSLVHEALRKAQREKQRKVGTVPAAPAQPHHPPPPDPVQLPKPVAPTPVAAGPVAPVTGEATSRPPSPMTEQPREGNRFLLPALIGCVAIVAIIAIVFLVINVSSVLRQTKQNAPAAVPLASGPVAQSTAPATPPVATQPVAQPRVDPAPTPNTPPPARPLIDESKYNISGIMKDPDGKPVAVINGRVAYEGYYIDGATVEKIEADRVTIDIKGQKALLRLH